MVYSGGPAQLVSMGEGLKPESSRGGGGGSSMSEAPEAANTLLNRRPMTVTKLLNKNVRSSIWSGSA